MSNTTHQSREAGQGRRRRSRGGRNRSKQQQDQRRGGERGPREGRGRSEEFRPQAQRPKHGRQPVKLSWWQKLLKAVGLYKEPAKPERRKEQPKPTEAKPPKSNTRNARSGDGATKPAAEPSAKRGQRNQRGGDRSTVESSRVYVGNLSYDVTEQDLQELFKGIGGVRNVEIVYNRSTHRSKGYGFVEMLHKDEAIRAVEVLHDQPFMGRKLIVSGAKSRGQDEREEREDGGEESRIVSLAPLPAAAPAESAPTEVAAESQPAPQDSPAEPVIATIIEDTTETAATESETRSEVA